MEIVWQAEIDEWCRRVLRSHWPDLKIYKDVREIDREAESIELLVGGFPCQDLSLAGRRKGLEGKRSSLFFEFARIADDLRPRWFLLENVQGIFSSAEGRDFAIVLSEMAKIGYGICWRVLDARFFGVPQRRRRVFIVGCLGEGGREQAVRALCDSGERDSASSLCSWQKDHARLGESSSVARCLTARNTRLDGEIDNFVVSSISQNQRDEIKESNISSQLSTRGGKPGQGYPLVRIASALDCQTGGPDVKSTQANHIVSTLQGGNTKRGHRLDAEAAAGNQLVAQDSVVRRLTPRECERLMGWPDDWTAVDGAQTPDSRRYGACGNGVVANVSEWIGSRILAVHNE